MDGSHSWPMPDLSVTSSTGLTLMPECRCRTEDVDYQKKCRCRTNFFPTFRHLVTSFSKNIAISIQQQGIPVHRLQCGPVGCVCNPIHLKCFLNARMPDSPASGQYSTGMNKIADAGTSPVPECSVPD